MLLSLVRAAAFPSAHTTDAAQALDISGYSFRLVYTADFTGPLKFLPERDLFKDGERIRPVRARATQGVDWVLEGRGDASLENGRLLLRNTDSDLVFWNTRVFPADFLLEFGMSPGEADQGQTVVFFSARSRDGEGIFDRTMPMREGDFQRYHGEALDCYHTSYWAANPVDSPRGVVSIWKSHGFHLVARGHDFVVGERSAPLLVRILKYGGNIEVEINGRRAASWEDDKRAFGPILQGGFIGLQQSMRDRGCSYTHFKVWAAEPK